MKRVEGTKGVHLLECINPYKNRWAIRFDLQPSVNEHRQNEGVNYLEQVIEHQPSIDDIRTFIANVIELYDKSEAVNQFTIGDIQMWLDKETRIGLDNDFRREKNEAVKNGLEGYTTKLWNPKPPYQSFDLPIDVAITMLSTLSNYAKECFNVTQAHKKALYDIETIDELLVYDLRDGYPSMITF